MNNPDLFKLRADLREAIAHNENYRKSEQNPKPEGKIIYLNLGDQ